MQVSLDPAKHGEKLLYETKLCSHNKQLKAILHSSSSSSSSSSAPLQPIQHNRKEHYHHQRRSNLIPDRVFRPVVKLESKSTSACTTDNNANSSNEDEKTEATEEPIMVFTTTITTTTKCKKRKHSEIHTLLETGEWRLWSHYWMQQQQHKLKEEKKAVKEPHYMHAPFSQP